MIRTANDECLASREHSPAGLRFSLRNQLEEEHGAAHKERKQISKSAKHLMQEERDIFASLC